MPPHAMPARRRLPPPTLATGLVAVTALLAGGCSGRGGGSEIIVDPFPQLRVVATAPTSAEVWLDEPVQVTFNRPIDPDSLSRDTLRVEVLAGDGQPTGSLVAGTFRLADNGTLVAFEPRLPRDETETHAGLRPGVTYRVLLPGGDPATGDTVRDLAGNRLAAPVAFAFATRTGSTAAELYRNLTDGGPRRREFTVTTATTLDAVPLNRFGTPPVEVRLEFDQPLAPAASNVPFALDTDPLRRNPNDKGRIYLEYDDPIEGVVWIPADVEFERNEVSGAIVVLRPVGVLPNNATVRVIVEATLQDLSGESNATDPGYDRVFGTFRTAAAWEQQWNGIVERFLDDRQIDPMAAFAEPMAEAGPGFLRAGFAFEGSDTTFDYTAPYGGSLLDTNVSTLVPVQGEARTFPGGIFTLRNLTVPHGSSVQGQGTNPLVLLCAGEVHIAGTLSVDGGGGARGFGYAGGQYRGPGDITFGLSGNQGNPGGIGRCGGGSGGDASPRRYERDLRGGTGAGPRQEQGGGGRGGYIACTAGCYTGNSYNSSGGGSGGGGGALATQGDPHFRGLTPGTIVPNTAPTAQTSFQQVRGHGGTGCSGGSGTRTAFLLGGDPGPTALTDTRNDNDFWGVSYDPHRRLRIVGELGAPTGGSGGGGGGDTSPQVDCSPTGTSPALDFRGGGGGAGGGVVVIKALGEIRITSTGRVSANGGNGGGGEMAGACGEAGGGGGGAGGMVVLISATAIRIEAHGNAAQNRFVYGSGSGGPFAGNDYDFAIAADGGVCTTGGFGALNLQRKYPASGQTPIAGTLYDGEPLGGFGGMGIVQLMTPPGDNTDGTNTVLDDNIHFYLPGALALPALPAPIGAAGKRQLLAWRGLPNGNSAVDDFGNPVVIGNDEGDIRPAPRLLPSPIGSRSRARSRWLDTGRSDRRPLAAPDAGARGLVVAGDALPGPRYEFAGIDPATGFAAWSPLGSAVQLVTPTPVPPTALVSAAADATFLGAPAYRLVLASPALGGRDRYVAYDADLLGSAGETLASYRILAHDDRELLVAPGDELLPTTAVRVRVAARCFAVGFDGIQALPADPQASSVRPRANVRIGFAFHRDPTALDPLAGRYPATGTDAFVHDLTDPALQAWLAANQPRFVMWDVLFDMAHDSGAGPAAFQPFGPRLELRDLRLPFRF